MDYSERIRDCEGFKLEYRHYATVWLHRMMKAYPAAQVDMCLALIISTARKLKLKGVGEAALYFVHHSKEKYQRGNLVDNIIEPLRKQALWFVCFMMDKGTVLARHINKNYEIHIKECDVLALAVICDKLAELRRTGDTGNEIKLIELFTGGGLERV